MRPIDADALLKTSRIGKILYFNDTTTDGYTDVLLAVEVERAPTIEAEPVRSGRWNKIQNFAKCSECMHEVNWGSKDFLSPYCPNCGAKMDGGENIP